MDIVADESVDFGIIYLLREKGYFIYSIHENASGINDQSVLQYSNQKNCLMITEDKDFGELVYRLKLKHKGILLIRVSDLPRSARVKFSVEMIHRHFNNLLGNFSVLTENGLRIKRH